MSNGSVASHEGLELTVVLNSVSSNGAGVNKFCFRRRCQSMPKHHHITQNVINLLRRDASVHIAFSFVERFLDAGFGVPRFVGEQ